MLGPNGAGKTTFVRTVATLLRPDGGTLHVAGHDVRRDPGGGAPRDRPGRPVRGHRAGDDRAREPGDGGAPVRAQRPRREGRRRHRCSTQLGLVDAGDRLARTYSGGMRRRLDLGASLVGTPVCSCSTSPPPAWIRAAGSSCGTPSGPSSPAGTDVLLTTQYLDEADHLASQVVIIDHGRAVAAGTPAELKRRIGGNVVEIHVSAPATCPGWPRCSRAGTRRRLDRRGHAPGERERRVRQRRPHERAALHRRGRVAIEDVAMRQPNLDEVFLALTGHPTDSRRPGRRPARLSLLTRKGHESPCHPPPPPPPCPRSRRRHAARPAWRAAPRR